MGDDANSRWLDAIEKHLSCFFLGDHERVSLRTLYLGGGTPSLLSISELEQLLRILAAHFEISNTTEFTMESNPENLKPDYIQNLRNIGVNRLSIGIQTKIPSQLKRLERLSTARHIESVVNSVSQAFQNFSLDFMIGIPDQTMETLGEDLEFIAAVHPPHLSAYLLTLGEDHKWKSQSVMSNRLASDGLASEMYARVCEFLEENLGYEHYEVSNFGQPGFQSRHNTNYWNTKSGYLAFGPGAHGYLETQSGERLRFEMLRDPARWVENPHGFSWIESLDSKQQNLEYLYLGLRTRKPILKTHFSSFDLEKFLENGWAIADKDVVTLTNQGWLLIESIAERLLWGQAPKVPDYLAER